MTDEVQVVVEKAMAMGADVRTEEHHPTAADWCSCHWAPDHIPQNPNGSGDWDALEELARAHRLEAVMSALIG